MTKKELKEDLLIGIDGNEANVKNRVGSNIYAFELLKQLSQMKNEKCKIKTLPASRQDCNLKFKIYLKSKPLNDLPEETNGWQYEVFGLKKFWTKLALPLKLTTSQPKPDVFFTPGHYAPCCCSCPTVISIMDLSYIYFPKLFKKRDLYQLRTWTACSIKKAAKILTISQFSKNAIIDYYQVEPNKVVVTYPGMKKLATAERRKFMEKAEKIRKKYKIEGDYLLYVGTLQPRKNLIRLIESLNILVSQYPSIQLVIVGKKGWLYDEIFSKVKELRLEKKVIFTGYVPDEELPAFYQGAQCFVLASLYEGFGLPVLEAMAYGCPVVVSNVSSLPEIVADAGISVNPESIKSIAQGIQKVLKLNPEEREELIKKGREQVKKFSWQKCAEETLAVLKEAAGVQR